LWIKINFKERQKLSVVHGLRIGNGEAEQVSADDNERIANIIKFNLK
jgi:hypothetical protein